MTEHATYHRWKCTAARCDEVAEYLVHGADSVVRPACQTHAAASVLFDAVADVRPLPTRSSPDRARRPRHA